MHEISVEGGGGGGRREGGDSICEGFYVVC